MTDQLAVLGAGPGRRRLVSRPSGPVHLYLPRKLPQHRPGLFESGTADQRHPVRAPGSGALHRRSPPRKPRRTCGLGGRIGDRRDRIRCACRDGQGLRRRRPIRPPRCTGRTHPASSRLPTGYWVQDRQVRHVSPPDRSARLAATTRQAAGRYGLTTELATVIPYDLPRRWAAAFRAERFDGIRHRFRHDHRARPSGIALFGPAGPAQLDDGTRLPLTVADIEAAGVGVLAPPHSAVLTVVR